MKLSVTPAEIAQHLIEELGHQKAVEESKYHLSRCGEDHTRTIWTNIEHEVHRLKKS